jgi:flavin reductase (DIM6/NTAB) family NADH-FMN oxidoreductase RutF
VVINPEALSAYEVYKLLIGSVVPRPIAWVSSVSREGVLNLAPFSFFTVVSRQPPMLSITVEPRPDGTPKDTLRNVRQTGQYVVNVVSLHLADAMDETSRDHPPETDEFEVADLTPVPGEVVEAPRVGEALVSMECVLDRVLPLGSDHLVIGRVVRFHVRDDLLSETGRVDVAGLDPLGRLAGDYTRIETAFGLPLPRQRRPPTTALSRPG